MEVKRESWCIVAIVEVEVEVVVDIEERDWREGRQKSEA